MLSPLWLVLYHAVPLLGFKHYQSFIPNGERVAHPCKPNYQWPGVGHIHLDGGGSTNVFGDDFKANGLVS